MSRFLDQAIRIAQAFSVLAFQPVQIGTSPGAEAEITDDDEFVLDESMAASTIQRLSKIPLHAVAWGRSGCKGRYATVSIVAKRAEYLPFILATLTPASVRQALAPSMLCQTERIVLPDLHGLQLKLQLVELASSWNEREAKALARLVLELTVPFPTRLVRRAYL